jgi:hypothetical protein
MFPENTISPISFPSFATSISTPSSAWSVLTMRMGRLVMKPWPWRAILAYFCEVGSESQSGM